MSASCEICLESSSNFKSIQNTRIGRPPISIKDLLLLCFEEADALPNNIGKSSEPSCSICFRCEKKLLEFYEATLVVSQKRREFQKLVRTMVKEEQLAAQDAMGTQENTASVQLVGHNQSAYSMDPSTFNDATYSDGDKDDADWKLECKPEIRDVTNEDSEDEQEPLASMKTRLQSAKALKYCHECDIECPTDEVFILHLRKVHGDSRFVDSEDSLSCPECKLEMPTKRAYKDHLQKIHPTSAKLKCQTCDRLFATSTQLENHQATHAPLLCFYCGLSFEHKQAMRQHMEADHTDVKEFQCDECGNLYISLKSLKKHKMVHSDTRDFECDECPRKFRNSSHLKRHKLTHSGLKPHVCPICYRTFALKYNMNSHMKEHSKPGNLTRRPECGSCGQFFTAQQLLNQHIAAGGCMLNKKEEQAPINQPEINSNPYPVFS